MSSTFPKWGTHNDIGAVSVLIFLFLPGTANTQLSVKYYN